MMIKIKPRLCNRE